MISLFGLMGAFFVLLLSASYVFYRKNSPVQYVISLVGMLASIFLFLYSIFRIGGFEGMGVGAVAAALFVASILSLFVSVLFNIINRRGKGAV